MDDQVFALQVTQAAQLTEESPPSSPSAGFCKEINGNSRMENRYPAPRRSLLRPRRLHRGEQQCTSRELPPPHSITLSARPSKVGDMVRPSAFAVVALTTNSNFCAA